MGWKMRLQILILLMKCWHHWKMIIKHPLASISCCEPLVFFIEILLWHIKACWAHKHCWVNFICHPRTFISFIALWKGASSRRVYSGANLLLRLDILGTDLGTPQNLMSVMKMLVPLGWYTFIINPPITPYIVGTIPKGTTILPDWWLGNQASSMGCLDFREKHGIHYISIGAGFLASTVLSQFWPTQRKRVRKKFDM